VKGRKAVENLPEDQAVHAHAAEAKWAGAVAFNPTRSGYFPPSPVSSGADGCVRVAGVYEG